MKLKKASLFTKIVILALIIYAGVTIAGVNSRIEEARREQAQLQSEVETAMQKNAALKYDLEHAADDETIEEIARAKLGLVKPGEKVFYDVSN